MRDKTFFTKFTGVVETDDTYIGGIHKGKRGRGASGKTAVVGVLERNGSVKAQPVEDMSSKTISRIVKKYVDPKAIMVCADEFLSYNQLALEYNLKRINHQIEYVNGQIHTQGIENFWSILKRGIVGVYHKVSTQYLPLYLNEFTFRYSHNGTPDLFLQVLKNGLIYDSSLTN
jgi:transposase-like protein